MNIDRVTAQRVFTLKLMPSRVIQPNGCWDSLFRPGGWGYLSIRGKKLGLVNRTPAHIISFIACKGSLKEGSLVLHKCDNPPCWNPEHLYAGSHTQNMIDKRVRGRSFKPTGLKNASAKLTEAAIMEIRASFGVSQSILARKFGVDQTTISDIKLRKTWTHI